MLLLIYTGFVLQSNNSKEKTKKSRLFPSLGTDAHGRARRLLSRELLREATVNVCWIRLYVYTRERDGRTGKSESFSTHHHTVSHTHTHCYYYCAPPVGTFRVSDVIAMTDAFNTLTRTDARAHTYTWGNQKVGGVCACVSWLYCRRLAAALSRSCLLRFLQRACALLGNKDGDYLTRSFQFVSRKSSLQ